MANKTLETLLKEWKHYEILKNTLPSRIARLERKSIARAIDSTISEMKKNKENYNLSEEDNILITKIMDLLEKDDFD